MALILPVLQSQLIQIFRQQLDDVSKIAQGIALAYQVYATAAQGPAGDPVILKGIELLPLRQNLTEIFKNRIPAPSASALIGLAVTQFWTAPPVQTALGGVVTACIPSPGVAAMQSIVASSIEDAAKQYGQALDTMTRTTIVTYPPVISPPGPIT